MSEKPSIPVATARDVAKKHDLTQVLLIGFDGELVHVVTYGKTKADCEAAAKAQDFWTGKIREFSFRGEYGKAHTRAVALRAMIICAKEAMDNDWFPFSTPEQLEAIVTRAIAETEGAWATRRTAGGSTLRRLCR